MLLYALEIQTQTEQKDEKMQRTCTRWRPMSRPMQYFFLLTTALEYRIAY